MPIIKFSRVNRKLFSMFWFEKNQMKNGEVNVGFWNVTGKIIKGVASALEAQVNELQVIKMRLEGKNSAELKQLIKSEGFFSSASDREKSVAMKILKERGEI
ncbi:hypothetical protein AF42_01693 [Citrobacter freundii MGH 56]|nr:hypothetical protein AF42_01693 [Citrobacter freundii MGH 56]